MTRSRIAALGGLVAFAPAIAHAGLVQATAHGSITSVSAELAPHASTSDHALIEIVYDDATPDTTPDPSSGTFDGAIVSWRVRAGSLDATASGGDIAVAIPILLGFQADEGPGVPMSSNTPFDPVAFFMGFVLPVPTPASDTLPAPGFAIDGADSTGWNVRFRDGDDILAISGAVESITFAAVPAPATGVALAFASALVTRRRR